MQFSWIPYYKEFADKLMQFQSNRTSLLALIYKHRDELLAKYLHDQNGEEDLLVDIDPFTVFGLFNRGISFENRLNSTELFKREFQMKADVPHDFNGIPVLNNQKSHFLVLDLAGKRMIFKIFGTCLSRLLIMRILKQSIIRLLRSILLMSILQWDCFGFVQTTFWLSIAQIENT